MIMNNIKVSLTCFLCLSVLFCNNILGQGPVPFSLAPIAMKAQQFHDSTYFLQTTGWAKSDSVEFSTYMTLDRNLDSLLAMANYMQILNKYNLGVEQILDYKIISEDEFIFIYDLGITNVYKHVRRDENDWSPYLTVLLGQTPQQRFRFSSVLPKDYWELKDKIITFKLIDVEKVEVLENCVKIRDVDFKAIKERMAKHLEDGKKYLDSKQIKKNK